MRALSATELLSVWECGLNQGYVDRAVSLLSAANPQLSVTEIAQLSIGRRDAALLTLRDRTFGSRITSVVTCPGCGGNFDLVFETEAILAAPVQLEDFQIMADGIEMRICLPNSLDVAAALANQDAAEEATRVMLRRCISANDASGNRVEVDDLPFALREAAEDVMSQADQQADVRLLVSCLECGRQWTEPFDIVRFFWAEIHAWAVRILREVHVLASAYGWTEQEILRISSARRSFYLEMAAA
jgi:hypothetical protein